MSFKERIFTPTEPIRAIKYLTDILRFNEREAQKIIDKQRMKKLDGEIIKKTSILNSSFIISLFEPEGKLKPFFVDTDFALFNKPANLLTHPKGRFIHESLCDSIKKQLGAQAQPCQRLDFETSGIILVSKNKKAERILKTQLEQNKIQKTYIALVNGVISKSILINKKILTPKKDEKKRDLGIRSKIHESGKEAKTVIIPIAHSNEDGGLKKLDFSEEEYLKLGLNNVLDAKLEYENVIKLISPRSYLPQTKEIENPAYTLLLIFPLTGRTHQIRLHLSCIGHPIVFEPLYGEDEMARNYLKNKLKNAQKRMRLHAFSIKFFYEEREKYFFVPPEESFLKIK